MKKLSTTLKTLCRNISANRLMIKDLAVHSLLAYAFAGIAGSLSVLFMGASFAENWIRLVLIVSAFVVYTTLHRFFNLVSLREKMPQRGR